MSKSLIQNGHNVTIICGSYDGASTGLKVNLRMEKEKEIMKELTLLNLILSIQISKAF